MDVLQLFLLLVLQCVGYDCSQTGERDRCSFRLPLDAIHGGANELFATQSPTVQVSSAAQDYQGNDSSTRRRLEDYDQSKRPLICARMIVFRFSVVLNMVFVKRIR